MNPNDLEVPLVTDNKRLLPPHSSFDAKLFSRCYRVGSTLLPWTLERTFDVPLDQARILCMDFRHFLSVILEKPLDEFEWVDGDGAGKVGAVIRYNLDHGGWPTQIHEKVTAIGKLDETPFVLEWENVGSDPPVPLHDYKSRWELKAVGSGQRTHLTWTRSLRQVYMLGCVPFGNWKVVESLKMSAVNSLNNLDSYYACEFPSRLPHCRDARIVIIGAGPAGLHMAFQLKKRGYNEITILEKESRFGGKTVTVPDGSLPEKVKAQGKEVVHELGTCYLSPGYFAVHALCKELIDDYGVREDRFETVGPSCYTVRGSDDSTVDKTFDEWINAEVGNIQLRGPLLRFLRLFRCLAPTSFNSAILARNMLQYIKLYDQFFGAFNYTMPLPLATECQDQLNMNFKQFLEFNGLDALVPLIAYAHTAQGYGVIERTPAFWGLSWISPELLIGYTSAHLGCTFFGRMIDKKEMFVSGWITLWEELVKIIDKRNIVFDAHVKQITRRGVSSSTAFQDSEGSVRVSYEVNGHLKNDTFDYVVIAAPLHLEEAQEVLLLTETERELFQKDIVHSQFRTTLYKCSPKPNLTTHLTIFPRRIIDPALAGKGDVFAYRDSYLARFPEVNVEVNVEEDKWPERFKRDPARYSEREQMCYQYADNEMSEQDLKQKCKQWLDSNMGETEILLEKNFDYFYHYDQNGLAAQKPWRLLSIQGENNTIWAHASNYFESVLDIVNYQNMMLDGLQGKLRRFSTEPPKNAHRPERWELEGVRCLAWLTGPLSLVVRIFFNCLWTLLWIVLWPLNVLAFFRIQRYVLQWVFRTKHIGWNPFSFSMKKFIDISPSALCLGRPQEDEIVKSVFAEVVTENKFDWIKRPHSALQWNFYDFRVMIREWVRVQNPRILGQVPKHVRDFFRWFHHIAPMSYHFFIVLFTAVNFTCLTGYGYAKRDDKGTHFYVPKCHMLERARKDYPEVQAERICTHLCKIFSEEAMGSVGITIAFEPNHSDGSCTVRGQSSRATCCCDNKLLEW